MYNSERIGTSRDKPCGHAAAGQIFVSSAPFPQSSVAFPCSPGSMASTGFDVSSVGSECPTFCERARFTWRANTQQLLGNPQRCVSLTNNRLAVRCIPLGTTKVSWTFFILFFDGTCHVHYPALSSQTQDELFFKFKQYGAIQSVALLPPRPGARYCFG